ncbi:heavy metal-associated domain-containing protein [Nocardia sp. NPDC052001]|uniref:heavy-metal-associated domain-containing protein n=1 Tax=unclassified Nocardia TaxID=2637762 RepID=UPI00342667D5
MSSDANGSSYTVSGITCGGCVGKVEAAVGKLAGVDGVRIELATGRMNVLGAGDDALIQATVEQLGYRVAKG